MNPIDVGASKQEQIPMPRFLQEDDEDWEDDIGSKPAFDASNTRQAGIKK